MPQRAAEGSWNGELLAYPCATDSGRGTSLFVALYSVRDGREIGTFGANSRFGYECTFAVDRDVLVGAGGDVYLWPFRR